MYLHVNKGKLLNNVSKSQVIDRLRFENPW